MTVGSFPNVDGLVAPGMQCTFVVTFTPDSLANYQEEMRVCMYVVVLCSQVTGIVFTSGCCQ